MENSGKKAFFTSSYFLLVAMVIALLWLGVVLILSLEGEYGTVGLYAGGTFVGTVIMAIIILLRQDEFAAVVVIAVSICVDWYLGLHIVAIIMALVLLLAFFLARSPAHPWLEPRALWLWALFLALTILPAIKGASTASDAFYYYPDLIFGALIMFWLGTAIARNITSLRRFFQMLAGLSTLIAVHTIIQATTGKLLFATAGATSYLTSVSGYQLGHSGISRAGSFFIQPDASSVFLAMMLFIPLGLLIESPSILGKALFLTEILLTLIALLFTYSTGAWLAAGAGIAVFVVLVGGMRYRIGILLCIVVSVAILFLGFPAQINLLFQHSSDPQELLLRQGLWETAWRVIKAFPLTGIGLGRLVYLQLANSFPYRVPAAYVAENNPHNSYLELGAMAGLPVLFVFLALLVFALWQALRLWTRVDGRSRSLLAAGMAAIIALSVNSWSFGAWTLPPLATLGWLVLGAISSPLLSKGLNNQATEESNS